MEFFLEANTEAEVYRIRQICGEANHQQGTNTDGIGTALIEMNEIDKKICGESFDFVFKPVLGSPLTPNKRQLGKMATKKSVKKSAKAKSAKSTGKSAGAKAKAGKRKPYPENRKNYSEALKKKVVKAISKGMTYKEAVEQFQVGINSIPQWLRKFR